MENEKEYSKKIRKDVIFLVLFKVLLIVFLVCFMKKVKPLKNDVMKNERIKPVLQDE